MSFQKLCQDEQPCMLPGPVPCQKFFWRFAYDLAVFIVVATSLHHAWAVFMLISGDLATVAPFEASPFQERAPLKQTLIGMNCGDRCAGLNSIALVSQASPIQIL